MRSLYRWCSDLGWRCLLACASGARRERMEWMGRTKCVSYFFMQRILRINAHVPWPVHWTSDVSFPDKITCLSRRSRPGYMPGQYIQAMNGIEIGENVRLGPGVKLISANHDLNDFDRHLPAEPIRIGDNSWLGANAIVLPGVRLGDHVVVAAGAVVSKDVEADCLVAGVPARVVKALGRYAPGAGPAG